MSAEKSSAGKVVLAVIGALLIVFGLYALAEQTGALAGLIPAWMYRLSWGEIRTGLTLIIVGTLVIWLARGGFRPPGSGARLYRTSEDRWLAGVLGGLARYFGVDATLLRLLFIVLLFLGAGWLVAGYILLAVLVPKQPPGSSGEAPFAPVPPAWTPAGPVETPPAPPAPPADPSAAAVVEDGEEPPSDENA